MKALSLFLASTLSMILANFAAADDICRTGKNREPFCTRSVITLYKLPTEISYDEPHREPDTTLLIKADRKLGEVFEITNNSKEDRVNLISKWKNIGVTAKIIESSGRVTVVHDVRVRHSAPQGAFLTCSGMCNFGDLLKESFVVKPKTGSEIPINLADISKMRQEKGAMTITAQRSGQPSTSETIGVFQYMRISGSRLDAYFSGTEV